MGILPFLFFLPLVASKGKVVKLSMERHSVLADDVKQHFNPSLSMLAAAPVKLNISAVVAYEYYVNISLGTPPQRMLAHVDTGSFFTWVLRSNCKTVGGPNTICEGKFPTFKVKDSTTGRMTKTDVPLRYGVGDRRVRLTGRAYFDQLTIGVASEPNSIPVGETMVLLLKNPWYSHPPGILGLGLPGCTVDDKCVVAENLMKKPEFQNETLFSITLSQCPPLNPIPCPDAGTLIFNGMDEEHCNISDAVGQWNPALRGGDMFRYPYWSLYVPRVQIGRVVLKLDLHFVLDSGSPVMLLPSSVYDVFTEEYPLMKEGRLNCSEPIPFYFWIFDDQHRYQIWPGDFLIPDPGTGLCFAAIQRSITDLFIFGTPVYRSFCIAHKLSGDGVPKVALHQRYDRPWPVQ